MVRLLWAGLPCNNEPWPLTTKSLLLATAFLALLGIKTESRAFKHASYSEQECGFILDILGSVNKIYKVARSGFLNLDTDILGQVVLCCRGLSCALFDVIAASLASTS